MRDDICTIPISEVFEENDGCPICRMRDTIEERITEYILGDAMMEPDVRISTNQVGFCEEHYDKMGTYFSKIISTSPFYRGCGYIKCDVSKFTGQQ